MAERLTDYLREAGVRVRYLHSDIDLINSGIAAPQQDARGDLVDHHRVALHMEITPLCGCPDR